MIVLSDRDKKNIVSDFYESEIPYFAITNHIHIEMFSNRHIVIDGSFSVLEYSNEIILLKLKKGRLEMFGQNLAISTVMEDKIVITGEITSISFDG